MVKWRLDATYVPIHMRKEKVGVVVIANLITKRMSAQKKVRFILTFNYVQYSYLVKSLLMYRKNYMSILFCYVVDEYTKVEESWCFSGQGYGSLLEAKYNCSLDSTCVGVLDEDCKNDYSFYLCHGDFEKVKTFRSCIYKKKDLVGKQRWPSKTFIQILFTY